MSCSHRLGPYLSEAGAAVPTAREEPELKSNATSERLDGMHRHIDAIIMKKTPFPGTRHPVLAAEGITFDDIIQHV